MSYPLKAVSPSMLNDFEGCAKRYKHVRILKEFPFQTTEQIKFGNVVHEALENHVKLGTVLPDHLQHMVPFFEQLRAAGFQLYPEIEMAVNKNWKPSGWWDKETWARGKVDLFGWNPQTQDAFVVDYKTGKRKEDKSQLMLYGAMAVSALGLKSVTTYYMWLAGKEQDNLVVNRENIAQIKSDFERRIGALKEAHETDNFPAKTSALCPWCPLIFTCDEAVTYRKKARFMKGEK